MRGFGVVQACYAHESQMDKLAEACGVDPVEIRLRNAMRTGDELITGQIMDSVAPVSECIREVDALPFPDEPVGGSDGDVMHLPGGAGRTADVHHVVRGIGYGVAMKNLMYSEGFDDFSTARCRLGNGVATLKFATAEVGQGFVTLACQIARTVLGVDEVLLDAIDTGVGSAGSTSASRQTWMSGGAVQAACEAVRDTLFVNIAMINGLDADTLAIDQTAVYRHRPTAELDARGQGDCHVAFAFVAHRAVVDVDVDLGLVKVVQVATAQDVGRALNPLSVLGQIEGGIAQGLGLAVMEEIVQIDGTIRNASFTDYLLPTMLDMPPVAATLVEQPEPLAPLGAKGVGEPPCISVTPAIAAAVRDALRQAGRPHRIDRVPIRPGDIVGV
jgi:CO/xanthine dehydrogenase Mo-binding subunit